MFVLNANFQSKPLSNCAGGGTCGTCMVEVHVLSDRIMQSIFKLILPYDLNCISCFLIECPTGLQLEKLLKFMYFEIAFVLGT